MDYFKLADGSVRGFDNAADAPTDAQSITAEQFAEIARTPVVTPAMAQAALVAAAQAQLDVVTGPRGQLARCQVVGIAFSPDWQAYVLALRNIANGTDTTSTALPTQPAFIEGT